MINTQPPHKKEPKKQEGYDKKETPADNQSLEQASPDDMRADEKVIVNEQAADKVVNTTSDENKPL